MLWSGEDKRNKCRAPCCCFPRAFPCCCFATKCYYKATNTLDVLQHHGVIGALKHLIHQHRASGHKASGFVHHHASGGYHHASGSGMAAKKAKYEAKYRNY